MSDTEPSSTPLQDAEEERDADLGTADGSRSEEEQAALDAMPAGTAEEGDQVVGREPDTTPDPDVDPGHNW